MGFDSVWVGDSLFSKPRYDPISLLGAISQRTRSVKMGTACLVTSMRNPLSRTGVGDARRALRGRTILGACMGNPRTGSVGSSRPLAWSSGTGRRSSRSPPGPPNAVDGGRGDLPRSTSPTTRSRSTQARRWHHLARSRSRPDLGGIQSTSCAHGLRGGRRARDAERDAPDHQLGDGWMTCCRAEHPGGAVEQPRCCAKPPRILARTSRATRSRTR